MVPVQSKKFLVFAAALMATLFCCSDKANAVTNGEIVFLQMKERCPEFVKKNGITGAELRKWDTVPLEAARKSCDISLLSRDDLPVEYVAGKDQKADIAGKIRHIAPNIT